jgi:hypothetical protein
VRKDFDAELWSCSYVKDVQSTEDGPRRNRTGQKKLNRAMLDYDGRGSAYEAGQGGEKRFELTLLLRLRAVQSQSGHISSVPASQSRERLPNPLNPPPPPTHSLLLQSVPDFSGHDMGFLQ